MALGCPERFNFEFIFKWVGGYRWRSRAEDLALMETLPPHATGVHLKSRRQVAAYLEGLQKEKGARG
jgi:hypothetical protein